MKQDIRKKKPVEISWRKKFDDELNENPKNAVVNVSVLEVLQGVHFSSCAILIVEWAFMQSKLGDVLNDTDRLESGSLNESDGGEECEAIITALRRAKRRALRSMHNDWKKTLTTGDEMEIDDDGERVTTGGKTLPNLRLTLNGH